MTFDKKRIHIIINPVSGTSSKKDLPTLVSDILDFEQFDITILTTEYAGHGFKIATKAVEENVDYVVAVGGDGTVNEVARALIGSQSVLGIIPMGSGNGLARDLNIAIHSKKALEIIAEKNVITIDYGKVNEHIFFCTCGVGFDAEVAHSAKGQKRRGMFMYAKNMIESFFLQKPQEYEIICPEGTVKDKAFVVTCANASQYGYNAHIAPHADIQDGKMNIMILKPLSIIDLPQTSVQLFSKKIDDNKKMLEMVTHQAIIKREKEGVMHVDGDPIHAGKELRVEIVPQGLKVLVPKNPPKRHPLNPQELLMTILNIW